MADVSVAPAAPAAVSAPVSTPVVSSPSAPSTSSATSVSTPSTPAAVAPAGGSTPLADTVAPGSGSGKVETPAGDSAAAPVAAGDGAKVAPKSENFDTYEEYLAAKWQFEEEAGTLGAELPATNPADPNAPAADPTAAATDPNDPNAPADPQLLPEPNAPVTPEALSAWMAESPEFAAALEAKPELKESLFSMARDVAKAAPLLDIFPDVDSANFANQTANTFVELQAGFQLAAEDPDNFPKAFDKFKDLFSLTDDKGEYLRDAAGNIKVGDDFNLLATHFINGYHADEIRTHEQQVQQLQQKLQSAVYPSAEAKAADEQALDRAEMAVAALRYVEGLKDGTGAAKPDLSKIADPELRAYYEQKDKELEERQKALGQDKADANKSARKQARQQYETEFRSKFGGGVGKRIGELVKAKLDAGTFIPSYVLEDRDPKTNAPMFAVRVLNEFEKKIKGISSIEAKQKRLELAPPSPQAMQQRLQYQQELVEQFLPGILDAEVRKVQSKEKADRAARADQGKRRGEVAQFEPRSGSTPQPRVLTDDQILATAKDNVRKLPGYEGMSQAEQNTAVLSEKYRLRFGA